MINDIAIRDRPVVHGPDRPVGEISLGAMDKRHIAISMGVDDRFAPPAPDEHARVIREQFAYETIREILCIHVSKYTK